MLYIYVYMTVVTLFLHLPDNRATSTPNSTTTHTSSAADTSKVSAPVTVKASRSNVSATEPAQQQSVTPMGKENEAKPPSRIPSGPPGGAANNPRHSVAGSSGLRNHRVKVIPIFLETMSPMICQRVFNVFYKL